MPELPEVETVRKGLTRLVVGKTIATVEVFWPRIVETDDLAHFRVQLAGQTIEAVNRRGKFLIFELTDFDLISHLRMEGKYEFFPETMPPSKHTHVIFTFTDKSQLHYRDVRKFGRFQLFSKGQSVFYSGIRKLGPEPTAETFSLKEFAVALKKSQKIIKPLLLDQRLVTGLGNIYVDEALWLAKIHPERIASSLTTSEIRQLHQAIISVLENAIEAGGTTIRTYQNALGEVGSFQLQLHAYGQQNQPCERCGTPLKKIKVAQRGTHFCPKCQKMKGQFA